MIYFSNFADYCMANKKKAFIFLVIFHAINVILFDFIQQSHFLSDLHDNKPGCWDFAMDCFLYQGEALSQLGYIENSQWMEWLLSYSDHLHVKIMSLVYWATGFSSPVVYEVTILPFVWASSILLIYNSSNILFPDSNKIPLLTCLFFFQPSFFLHSTQLLRDPYFTLGFCFLIYGMVVFYKTKLSFNGAININIGILLMLAMRSYLSPLLLLFLIIFSLVALYHKRSSYLYLLIILLPLLLFQNISINRYMSFDQLNKDLSPAFYSMPDLDRFEEIIGNMTVKEEEKFEKNLAIKLLELENSLIALQLEDPLPQLEDPLLQLEDPLLQLEDPLPQLEDPLPQLEDSLPQLEDPLLQLEDSLPQLEDSLPQLEDSLPQLEDSLPQLEDSLPQLEDSLPQLKNGTSQIKMKEKMEYLENKLRQEYKAKKVRDKLVEYEYVKIFDSEKFEEKTKRVKESLGFFSKIKINPETPAYLLFVANTLDRVAIQLSALRLGFHNYGRNIQGGSFVDVNQDYLTFDSIIAYLPKASYYGFLSPFPTSVFKSGHETGRIGSVLAGIEILIFYVVLVGVFYMLFKARTQIAPISVAILLSVAIIILLGYVIPNLGALYRMRQPYLLPFYLAGVQGLYLLFKHSNSRLN